jgi:hypothetical protein
VETLTRPPQTPVQPRAIADRPRHWPKRVLAAALATSVAAGAAAVTWISNVEPIGRGTVVYAITDRSLHVTQRSVDALGVTGTVQTMQMRRDMTFTYRFSLKNAAPVPITIVDVGSHGDDEDISIRPVAAKPALWSTSDTADGYGPFEPFQVAAGDEAGLEVRVHVSAAACAQRGSAAVIWQLPVTYRILGLTRHSRIDTGTELRLVGTGDTAC